MDDDGAAVKAWVRAMREDDFAAAWAISDGILARDRRDPSRQAGRPPHLRAYWDGRPFDGRRLLLRCDRGLGDAVQFVRFCARMRARVAGLAVKAPARLLPLLATADGIDALVPGAAADPPHDVAMEMTELGHALRVTPADLPGPLPYLTPDPDRVAAYRDALGGRLAVGLAWEAREADDPRSIPTAALAALPPPGGADWVSLQLGPATEAPGLPAFRLGPRSPDGLLETAALVAALDAVVAVDSFVAHLAGALGRPVVVLLPHVADWRWGRAAVTPWYPTARLLRQPAPGAWPGVLAAAAATAADAVRRP